MVTLCIKFFLLLQSVRATCTENATSCTENDEAIHLVQHHATKMDGKSFAKKEAKIVATPAPTPAPTPRPTAKTTPAPTPRPTAKTAPAPTPSPTPKKSCDKDTKAECMGCLSFTRTLGETYCDEISKTCVCKAASACIRNVNIPLSPITVACRAPTDPIDSIPDWYVKLGADALDGIASFLKFKAQPSPYNGNCKGGGGCNRPPQIFSKMTLTPKGSAPTYVTSSGWEASKSAAISAGVDAVRHFLGSSSPVRFYKFKLGGVPANYDTICTDYDSFIGRPSSCPKSTAMGSNPAYYMSGKVDCACNEYTVTGLPIIFMPGASEDESNFFRAVHEYTHTVQTTMGGPLPSWLMEGGAVFMECVMANRNTGYGTTSDYQSCMRTGGGGSGIIANVRSLYATNKNWLTIYGADRKCQSEIPPSWGTNPRLNDDEERKVYYDVGAFAIAFAIYRAKKQNVARSFQTFWQTKGTNGMMHNIVPYKIDYAKGWPSDVPEGHGWKKALADFTGYSTVADFYKGFEAFVNPGGSVASESTLLAILESNSDIAASNTAAASVSISEIAKTTCTSGKISETGPESETGAKKIKELV